MRGLPRLGLLRAADVDGRLKVSNFLDSRQRLIFMEWCKSQAETCRAMADQMEKLMVNALSDQLSKRERQKAAAFTIVAMELAAHREEFSVKSEDVGDLCQDEEEGK